ncbi:MAG: PaaI family thioesterase [Pseudomonadota bacterium]
MSGNDKPDASGFGNEIPFVALLGFELELYEGGESVIGYTPKPEHQNSFGVTHGGACMTLLDVAMARAARSMAKDMGAITIEMKTSFMRPTPGDGSRLTGKGRIVHRTASLVFTEATIYDAQGQACAHATGTFKYAKPRPAAPGPGSANADQAPAEASRSIISSD